MQNETYDPLSIESKWQEKWEQGKKFQPIESDKKFSIVIPPPNVTGSLHMGHALEHSIIDVITRVKRMNGFHSLASWYRPCRNYYSAFSRKRS